MAELLELTLVQARKKLLAGELRSVELVDAFIDNIEKSRRLNAFILDNFEQARDGAKKCDANIATGKCKKLEGIPMGIKDVFCTKGIRTTAGSRILGNFIPPYESTVTQRLQDENYLMLGKTNTDEFTCGSTTATSCFGPTVSYYRAKDDERDLTPGGSSGGSAAAVSAKLCIAAMGTDTGGSIRQPAALCNLVGLKPTYGRISRYGTVAYASSFDQAGPLTRDIEDCAYLLDILCGYDDRDSTTYRCDPTNFYGNLEPQIKSQKIGVIKEFMGLENKVSKDIYSKFFETVDKFRREGCEIIELSIPTIDYVPELYIVLSYTELASNLARYDGVRYGRRSTEKLNSLEDLYLKSRSEGFCDNIKKRILLGYFFSSSENYERYFLKAQKVRRKLANEFLDALSKVSLIITPATPQTAFPLNQREDEKIKNMESNYLNDLFVCPLNMAGLPGLVVPVGFDSRDLPIGVQLIGKHFDEQTILNAGLFIEKNR
ncbi:MAG: Asp-tRNA(Asn)/Glu-tRNA(Gln) amidotransferase subunit GatA [Rickettsiales bacterium]|jgi:aspartyl-tRNA(Asn)/glutamyl-tRNA(Gln) amidotransferase subunit A|nr:Asp-tRNA(Asn)/Glu-tRNA(Gln) amidotransferase subunit GatA [Rickettsiales bacterium]